MKITLQQAAGDALAIAVQMWEYYPAGEIGLGTRISAVDAGRRLGQVLKVGETLNPDSIFDG